MKRNFIDFVFEFFNNLRQHRISLVYDGEINYKIIQAFTDLTNNELEYKKEPNPIKKKVFNVLVECLQNISKHAECIEKNNNEYGRGIILVSETPESYNITTGNVVKSVNIDKIKLNIDLINSKNKEELREFFKERLSTGRISKKGGAGLGFIDIAKKSGNKLEYSFSDINKDYKFFILNAQISKIADYGKN